MRVELKLPKNIKVITKDGKPIKRKTLMYLIKKDWDGYYLMDEYSFYNIRLPYSTKVGEFYLLPRVFKRHFKDIKSVNRAVEQNVQRKWSHDVYYLAA